MVALLLLGLISCKDANNQTTAQGVETTPDTEIAVKDDPAKDVLTIIVPADVETYKSKIAEYVQVGGDDPLPTIEFIKKEITPADHVDDMKASAKAAARVISPAGGGPQTADVDYLKVDNGTAYILLNIDKDGWAGVSVTRAQIHPLVEKTLLQFSTINKVIFDYAPGDAPQKG